jgi:hypothetical protein
MEALGWRGGIVLFVLGLALAGMNGQRHASAALPPGAGFSVYIGLGAGWAPELVLMQRLKKSVPTKVRTPAFLSVVRQH